MVFVRSVFGVPNIYGRFACAIPAYHTNFAEGAFRSTSYPDDLHGAVQRDETQSVTYGYAFSAVGYNSLYNGSTIQPNSLSVLALIRL